MKDLELIYVVASQLPFWFLLSLIGFSSMFAIAVCELINFFAFTYRKDKKN